MAPISATKLLIPALLCAAAAGAQQAATLPAAPQASVAQVQTLVADGRLDDAMAQLRVLATQSPEPAGVERLRGRVLYLRGDFAGAQRAFATAMQQDPTDSESAQMRGVALYRLGRPADAIPLLEHARGVIPDINVDGRYVLGLCYINLHQFDDARRAFASLFAVAPDSAAAYVLEAQMLLRWQNPAAAAEAAQKAIDLDAHIPEAHLILGQAALAGSALDRAIAQFREEIEVNPVSGAAYEHLGDAYLRKQQFADAQDVLNRAVLLEPNSTGPFILLGQVLLKSNQPALAVPFLRRAEDMDPSNSLTHFALLQAYRSMGDKEDAAREAKATQRTTEPNPE